jgi:hypothetical protein
MIGQLYNANNVVVGQAALMVAPVNTPCPLPATAVMSDPFSLIPWTAATIQASATISAGSYVLTYTLNGTPYAVASQTATSGTAAQLATAIVAALAPLGATANDVFVNGGPVSAPLTPINIGLSERLTGGVWSMVPTGITGGVLTLTQPLWTPVGATDQGWTFASNKSTQAINIEEQSATVAMEMTTQSITIAGALSEDIASTLAMAYNMLATVNAPTVTVPGYTALSPTDNILQYAVALIMANRLGYPRWLYIPQTTCLANASAAFRRASAKRMYTADFQSVCPIASIAVYDFTAPHM